MWPAVTIQSTFRDPTPLATKSPRTVVAADVRDRPPSSDARGAQGDGAEEEASVASHLHPARSGRNRCDGWIESIAARSDPGEDLAQARAARRGSVGYRRAVGAFHHERGRASSDREQRASGLRVGRAFGLGRAVGERVGEARAEADGSSAATPKTLRSIRSSAIRSARRARSARTRPSCRAR